MSRRARAVMPSLCGLRFKLPKPYLSSRAQYLLLDVTHTGCGPAAAFRSEKNNSSDGWRHAAVPDTYRSTHPTIPFHPIPSPDLSNLPSLSALILIAASLHAFALQDRVVEEKDGLRAEVELLKVSKDGIVTDMEDLEVENEDLVAGERGSRDPRRWPPRAEACTREYQAALSRDSGQGSCSTNTMRSGVRNQLASKQETRSDLIAPQPVLLQDELRTTKHTLKATQHDLAALHAMHTAGREHIVALSTRSTLRQDEITALKVPAVVLVNSENRRFHSTGNHSLPG
ncbi:hypothetical protein K466DRAFT_226680 [Polyporus arcularius HHB13444]|uniref:Uncharacterized protein n=1 Tax=Polyporus arcularius HHB13444 TaxID=1314778 RepID=A0A5C3P439_9APHY|nr:hypothetical protein K466DRAFT_226680 [Polyporus arcularius HHB13444]